MIMKKERDEGRVGREGTVEREVAETRNEEPGIEEQRTRRRDSGGSRGMIEWGGGGDGKEERDRERRERKVDHKKFTETPDPDVDHEHTSIAKE